MLSFEDIVRGQQSQLKKSLMSELSQMGYKTKTKSGFLYAKGELPVLLVAHLDTVHTHPVNTICYSDDGNIIMSPEGIGGDDRAGIYMILKIIKKHRCHVLFCEDEEKGGVGAKKFVDSGILPKVNYIVELDRHGDNDAVFYDCDNPEFTKFVEGFGFKEAGGSFSDISVIAPAIGAAAVNISTGYYNEHTRHEYVDMEVIQNNIERVGTMITTKSDHFEYIEAVYTPYLLGGKYYENVYDFNSYYTSCDDYDIVTLMELNDENYVRTECSEMEECYGQYFIDESGCIYEFLDDIGVMVAKGGYSAHNAQGLPPQFCLSKSDDYEVISELYALELQDEIYWDE